MELNTICWFVSSQNTHHNMDPDKTTDFVADGMAT